MKRTPGRPPNPTPSVPYQRKVHPSDVAELDKVLETKRMARASRRKR